MSDQPIRGGIRVAAGGVPAGSMLMMNARGEMQWAKNPCNEVPVGEWAPVGFAGETSEEDSDTSLQYIIRPKDLYAPPVFVQVNATWGWMGKCPACGTVGKTGERCFACPRLCLMCRDPRPCQHELKERARRLLGSRNTLKTKQYNYLNTDGTVCSSVVKQERGMYSAGSITVMGEETARCHRRISHNDIEYTSMQVTCIACLAT